MAKPLKDWDISDAILAISFAINSTVGEDAFEANKAYVEDNDHWQEGAGWIGPDGGVKDSAARAIVLAGVEAQFTPVDAINEVLDRQANALMQQEPDVSFEPIEPAGENGTASDEQIAASDDMRRAIAFWWDKKKLWQKARQSLKRSRYSTRGALRLWIPSGRLIESGEGDNITLSLPEGLDFRDALMQIELDAPLPDAVVLYLDPDTQDEAAVVHYVQRESDGKQIRITELWYVEGDETVIRILTEGDAKIEGSSPTYRVKMGGRLPVREMRAELLITEPVRKQQARLNFIESILVRVAESGGFAERYTTNAQPNGVWLKEAPPAGTAVLVSKMFGDTTYYLHPLPRTLGAAVTTELRGLESTDDQGKVTYATPGVVFKEPTDPDFAIKSAEHAHETLLKQCKQGHVVLKGSHQASGTAYQQARADFEADLNGAKGPTETLVREIIESLIAWAESMSTTASQGFLDEYRCVVNLNVTSGPITPDEQKQNNDNVKAGTLSIESAMAMNGIEDVQSELDRMANDPDAVITLRTKQVNAIAILKAEGMTWERAAQVVGIVDKDELALYKAQDDEAATALKQQQSQDQAIKDALLRAGHPAGGPPPVQPPAPAPVPVNA